MLDGNVPMALGDSLVLSGIGMLVVFLELVLLAGLIVVVSKMIRSLSKKDLPAEAIGVIPATVPVPAAIPAPAPVASPVPAYAAPVPLTLADVDEPTAATVMAVVSHQSGIPLNHLNFRSIKGQIALEGVEEREAAVIMALTAHQLNKPVNKLIFKSIKAADTNSTHKV